MPVSCCVDWTYTSVDLTLHNRCSHTDLKTQSSCTRNVGLCRRRSLLTLLCLISVCLYSIRLVSVTHSLWTRKTLHTQSLLNVSIRNWFRGNGNGREWEWPNELSGIVWEWEWVSQCINFRNGNGNDHLAPGNGRDWEYWKPFPHTSTAQFVNMYNPEKMNRQLCI